MTSRPSRLRRAALPAALLVTAALTAACGGSGGADGAAGPSASSTNPVATPMAPAKALMYGHERFVSPCQLLPVDTATKLADYGPNASIQQQYDELPRSAAEMSAMWRNASRGVDSKCLYYTDDARGTLFALTVEQFASPELAMADWTHTLRLGNGADLRAVERMLAKDHAAGSGDPRFEQLDSTFNEAIDTMDDLTLELAKEEAKDGGGHRVDGLDASILYVPGNGPLGVRGFVGVHGNEVLKLVQSSTRHNPLGKVKSRLSVVKQVFADAYRHLDDDALSQAPLPSWWAQTDGWPTFVEPCAVMDDKVLSTTVKPDGHLLSDEVESASTERDLSARLKAPTPSLRATTNGCRRTLDLAPAGRPGGKDPITAAKLAGGTSQEIGDVGIWYAAPGDDPADLLASVISHDALRSTAAKTDRSLARLVAMKIARKVTVTGAEDAYRVGHLVYAQVDRRVVRVAVWTSDPHGEDDWPSDGALLRATTLAVTAVRSAGGADDLALGVGGVL